MLVNSEKIVSLPPKTKVMIRLEPTKEEQTSEKFSEKSYKVKPISPDIKKWSGCASFTEEELDNNPRLKAILSR